MTRDETIALLREKLPRGTAIWTLLKSQRVDANGNMHRGYNILAAVDGEIWVLDKYLIPLGYTWNKRGEYISTTSPASNLVDMLAVTIHDDSRAFQHRYL